MTFETWLEAVAAIQTQTSPATEQQRRLATMLGLQVSDEAPGILVAARLRTALSRDLYLALPREVNVLQNRRIALLVGSDDIQFSPTNELEADDWITYLRLSRRSERLQELQLVKGDIVRTSDGAAAEVSSIGADGRIFFKGGGGFGSWPDLVTVIARRGETTAIARKAKSEADLAIALRGDTPPWSVGKSQDLAEFRVDGRVTIDDIAELESVITRARDEKPIQKFLETHSHLLTALLGGVQRFCLPQKRLGGDYIPDFVIGDVDSRGVRWVLVELETPRSRIYLKDGSRFDKATTKGFNQIIEWRKWLSDNIGYARSKRRENGLGLIDIRPKPKGLVLVGRRSFLQNTKEAQRLEYSESNDIDIHTYDWLLESLRGIIEHHGPPATNPYLLHRELRATWDDFSRPSSWLQQRAPF